MKLLRRPLLTVQAPQADPGPPGATPGCFPSLSSANVSEERLWEQTDVIPQGGKVMLDKILPKKIQKVLGLRVKFAPGHSSELSPDGKRFQARMMDGAMKLQFEVQHKHGSWRLSISRVNGPNATVQKPVLIAKSSGSTVASALNSMQKHEVLPVFNKPIQLAKKSAGPAALGEPTTATGVYKGKKYVVLGLKPGGKWVQLAWFSDQTKSFSAPVSKVQIQGSGIPTYVHAQGDQPRWFRFSTTLVGKFALKDRGVDVTEVMGPSGKNIGGAKRTNRTGGWRDRILTKFNNLSGLSAHTFGDLKTKHKENPTMADWEAIKSAIEKAGGEGEFLRPKGWSQTALIVKVSK